MALDLDRIRADTPGVAEVVHLNNAGAALPPTPVLETQIAHLRREAAIGGYETAAEAADRTEDVYRSIARLIGAAPHGVALVENATRAWDMAVYGFPFAAGDRVLTGRSEYASNVIALLQMQQRTGIEIVLVEDDEHGQISLERLEAELDAGAAMVALTHVPTNSGLVNPAGEVGELCASHGVPFVLDACQSVGQLPVDVGTLGCDVLSATGRKYLRAPRGTGFLWVRDEWIDRLEPPFLDLHAATWTGADRFAMRDDARRFECWEANVAARLGLGAATDYALELDPEETWTRIRELADHLRSALEAAPGVEVHDKGVVRGGIVTFTVEGRRSEEVSATLRAAGVNTSVSPPEFARFDLPERGLPSLVRASVHYYNTHDEIDALVAALPGPPAPSP